MFQRIFSKAFGRKHLKSTTSQRDLSFQVTFSCGSWVDLQWDPVSVKILVEGDCPPEIVAAVGRSLVPLTRLKVVGKPNQWTFSGVFKLNSGFKWIDFYVKYGSSFSFIYLGSRSVISYNSIPSADKVYKQWIKAHDSLCPDRVAFKDEMKAFKSQPLISIVIPTYNTPKSYLREAIDSVLNQIYGKWELCIADDASPKSHVKEILQEYEKYDSRIKVVYRTENGHISAASNSALELATGEFIALMDHDDILPELALCEVVREINAYPDVNMIYTDEDIIDDKGVRHTPHFKNDLNWQLLNCQNMISHLGVYRRSLVEKLGGFRLGFEGSQDHDLALRAIAASSPDQVRHIPQILYHWRQNGADSSFSNSFLEKCIENSQKAVADILYSRGGWYQAAYVTRSPCNRQFNRVEFLLPTKPPKVSIIVPVLDPDKEGDWIINCVDSILNETDYNNFEIVLALNGVFNKPCHDPRVRMVTMAHETLTGLVNYGVSKALGEIIIVLSSRIEVITRKWLAEIVSQVIVPDTGVVGPKLIASDGTVSSAGLILGMEEIAGVAGHYGRGAERGACGFFAHLVLQRNVSAVSGACLAVRRELFTEAGAFDEKIHSLDGAAIDLCLRIGEAYQIVWTPYAELFLRVDETAADAKADHSLLVIRWGKRLKADPYYNPNLSLKTGPYGTVELAVPSRRIR